MAIRLGARGAALAFVALGPILAAASAHADERGFRSPSGNIHCAPEDGGLRCDVAERTFRPPQPRPRDCPLDYGGAVWMTPRGAASVMCAGDTILDPRRPVLPYGTAWKAAGGFECSSSPAGVRCANAAGRGWELSRDRLRLF